MAWLGILKLLFTLTNTLMSYLHDKQLLDAGQAKQMSADLLETLDGIQKAKIAVAAVRDDSDSVRNDPDNRDNDATQRIVH